MNVDDSELLRVIRLWAAVAWADGKLAGPEGESLRRLITGSGLSEAERAVAQRFLEERVTLPEESVTGMSWESKKGVYRAACRIAMVDRDLASEERATLHKLRDLLGVTPEVAREIEADIGVLR